MEPKSSSTSWILPAITLVVGLVIGLFIGGATKGAKTPTTNETTTQTEAETTIVPAFGKMNKINLQFASHIQMKLPEQEY